MSLHFDPALPPRYPFHSVLSMRALADVTFDNYADIQAARSMENITAG